MKSSQYYLMPLGSLLQHIIPRWLALRIAWFLVWLAFPLLKSQRRVIAENLGHMLGRTPQPSEVDSMARRVLRNAATCNLDLLRAPNLTRHGLLSEMVLNQGDMLNLRQALAGGRGAVLVTAHLGNWDLAGIFVASEGLPIAAVYERIPKGMSDAFNRFRGTNGMALIGMHERNRMNHALEPGSLFKLLGDRDLRGNGLALRWFHGQRTFPRGPAAFSLRHRVPIVTACFVLEPGDRQHRYRVIVHPPIEFVPTGDPDRDIDNLTARVVGELESLVAKYPDQWLVFQPRWLPERCDTLMNTDWRLQIGE